MKNRRVLPIVFTSISSFIFVLGVYVLAIKTTFNPQFFITTCGEVLRNIQEHVHFNPDGALSFFILFVTAISLSLALLQLIRFIVSNRLLHRFQTEEKLPTNVRELLSKYDVSPTTMIIVKNTALTAHTIGLLTPKIVVSRALIAKLSQEQLEAVVLHELYHLRSRHVLWLLLSRLISSLFFFIPVVGYLAQQLKTEFELAADAFVVEKQRTRDHLCSSLAFNIQYASGVIPHFATSPIEKRVNYLVDNKLSFERVGIQQLAISLLSLGVMLSTAFVQPNQVAAAFVFESGGICSVAEGCQTTDCSGFEATTSPSLTSNMSATFPFSR